MITSFENTEYYNMLVEKLYGELEKAETKHPVFCNKFTNGSHDKWDFAMGRFKRFNDSHESTAESIIHEEVAEAFEAVTAGRKEDAKTEFLQVALVALRCIEKLDQGE